MRPLVCNIWVADSSYLPPNFLTLNNIVKPDITDAKDYLDDKLDELIDWMENDESCTSRPEYQISETYKKTSVNIIVSVPDIDGKYIEVLKFTANEIDKDTRMKVICDLNGDNCFVTCTSSYSYNQLVECIRNEIEETCDEFVREQEDTCTAIPVQECNFDEMFVKVNDSYTRKWFIVADIEEKDTAEDKEIQVDLPL